MLMTKKGNERKKEKGGGKRKNERREEMKKEENRTQFNSALFELCNTLRIRCLIARLSILFDFKTLFSIQPR